MRSRGVSAESERASATLKKFLPMLLLIKSREIFTGIGSQTEKQRSSFGTGSCNQFNGIKSGPDAGYAEKGVN